MRFMRNSEVGLTTDSTDNTDRKFRHPCPSVKSVVNHSFGCGRAALGDPWFLLRSLGSCCLFLGIHLSRFVDEPALTLELPTQLLLGG